MSITNSSQFSAWTRPDRWPGLVVSAVVAFYWWNRLLFRWAGIVVRPVLAIFMIAAAGELLVNLGRQYQTALISSVVGRLADQDTAGGAEAANWLNAMLPDKARQAAFLLVGVVVLVALLQFMFRAIDALANSRMMASLQSILHDKLMGLGTQWYDRKGNDTGANVQIVNLAPVAQQALALVVRSPLVEGVSVATAFMLIFQGLAQLPHTPLWVEILAAILLLGLPVLGWQLSQPVRHANESVVSAQKSFLTELLNSLSQPLAIQTLGGERQRSARMHERLQALALARFRTAWRGDAANEFKGALPFLLQALFLVYAVVAIVRADGLSGASLGGSLQAIVLIQGLVPVAVQSTLSIIDIFTGINQQWPMIASVGEILDLAPPAEAPNATNWPKDAKHIDFQKISFSYGPSLPLLLDGVDYEFTSGMITAIAGATGSGKSTAFQLLTRLRQPTGGTIIVAGTELNSIRLDEVRRHIGIVHQSPPFLTDTVRANFQLVSMDATDAEIEVACRKVGIWEVLVTKNPAAPLDQHMTHDGGGANDFSGGERRRLAIARGLLSRPSLLLFDEPTAGIDSHTLELVADAIKRASAGITSIVIDHNLDFILGVADRVCVLSGGHFVQTGDPRQLAELPGPFHELLEAVRRLAGDTTMTTTSYPMPARSDRTASGVGPFSPVSMGQRPDTPSNMGARSDAPPMGQRPDPDAAMGLRYD
jgi:ATP-binding cassette, subfamily B, bacterial